MTCYANRACGRRIYRKQQGKQKLKSLPAIEAIKMEIFWGFVVYTIFIRLLPTEEVVMASR